MCAKKQTAKSLPQRVLVEVRALKDPSLEGARSLKKRLRLTGCTVDPEFEPVPMGGGATHIIRCIVKRDAVVEQLRRHPEVVGVWKDTPIAPMT
jgi:hypothetical protein